MTVNSAFSFKIRKRASTTFVSFSPKRFVPTSSARRLKFESRFACHEQNDDSAKSSVEALIPAEHQSRRTSDRTKKLCVDERRHFQEEDSEDEIEEECVKESEPFKRGEKGCRCSRSKCLKQYCLCFRTDKRCDADCSCRDCMNDGCHERERMMAVRHVKQNSTTAFKGTSLAVEESQKQIRGCRCKKSRCQKKVLSSMIHCLLSVTFKI
jgi:hypothetical protein